MDFCLKTPTRMSANSPEPLFQPPRLPGLRDFSNKGQMLINFGLRPTPMRIPSRRGGLQFHPREELLRRGIEHGGCATQAGLDLILDDLLRTLEGEKCCSATWSSMGVFDRSNGRAVELGSCACLPNILPVHLRTNELSDCQVETFHPHHQPTLTLMTVFATSKR